MNKRNFIKEFTAIKKIIKNSTPYIERIPKKDPFKILIGCVLSTRTRDEITEKVCSRLLSEYDTPSKILSLDTKKLERLIYPVGFYKKKAILLKEICIQIIKDFKGKVPSTKHQLLQIRGVGPKCANLVLSLAFKKCEVCVDTHVHRISNRLGWTETKTPLQTEQKLKDIFPSAYLPQINTYLVIFGKNICKPLHPQCKNCILNRVCKYHKNKEVKL